MLSCLVAVSVFAVAFVIVFVGGVAGFVVVGLSDFVVVIVAAVFVAVVVQDFAGSTRIFLPAARVPLYPTPHDCWHDRRRFADVSLCFGASASFNGVRHPLCRGAILGARPFNPG